MAREPFGRLPDGSVVERVTLRGGGLTARVMTWGAVVQDLRMQGHEPPLVLGFDRFEDYPAHSRYFGAIAGRCANRIADARFELDGQEFRLDPNFLGKHHLHGGSLGTGKRLWRIADLGESHVTLAIELADGEMGYPGAMRVQATYALPGEGVLDIRIRAECDRPTLCNFAPHSYFNLSGEPDILNHSLRVGADHYLPVDAELIPTGQVAPVQGTDFDLRAGARLGDVCARQRLDHNFCLSDRRVALREVAELTAGALRMRIRTTEPGLQVFDAAPFDLPVPGLGGRRIGPHAGLAIEPQVWPDAIHHPDWPQPILRPGETCEQHSQFVFERL